MRDKDLTESQLRELYAIFVELIALAMVDVFDVDIDNASDIVGAAINIFDGPRRGEITEAGLLMHSDPIDVAEEFLSLAMDKVPRRDFDRAETFRKTTMLEYEARANAVLDRQEPTSTYEP